MKTESNKSYPENYYERIKKILLSKLYIAIPSLLLLVLAAVFPLYQAIKEIKEDINNHQKLSINLISINDWIFLDSNSIRICQRRHYEVLASDLIEDVQIEIVFKDGTEIYTHEVLYSIPGLIGCELGCESILHKKHHLNLSLKHDLDKETKVHIYLVARRIQKISEDIKLEPKIRVKGRDKDGHIVYQYN